MSYQFSTPEIIANRYTKDIDSLLFLKVVSQLVWRNGKYEDGSNNDDELNEDEKKLNIGDITWISKYHYNDDNEDIIHPENNRFCANYNKEAFEIINPPKEYIHLIDQSTYPFKEKYNKKKLIL